MRQSRSWRSRSRCRERRRPGTASRRGSRHERTPTVAATALPSLAKSAAGGARRLHTARALLDDPALLAGTHMAALSLLAGNDHPATLAVIRERASWQGRFGAVITLAAPLRGCNAGPLMNWAWLATGSHCLAKCRACRI